MLRRVATAVLFAALALSSDASAQTAQPFSIQASALGVQLTGISNEELAFGGGGEIQVRWNPSRFSVGIGFQSTRHELDNNNVTFNGVFLEPRYVLAALGETVGLYLSARLVSLDATFTILAQEFVVDGSAVSGGGGLLIRLGSRVNGDVGLTVGKEYYDGEPADGVTIVTRLGVAIGIG